MRRNRRRNHFLDHDDFGLNQSKIMNVIDSNKLERDMQISLRNLRKLDCAGKPVPTFPHPALGTSATAHRVPGRADGGVDRKIDIFYNYFKELRRSGSIFFERRGSSE
jgi:hypothetical protein